MESSSPGAGRRVESSSEGSLSPMQRLGSVGFISLIAALTIIAAVALALQQQEASPLRLELAQAQAESRELARLKTENQAWREKQISAAELESLRSDHAALPRLREELEALKKPGSLARP